MSKTRRDMLELSCDLTDAELIERARTGAHAQEELVKLEGIKKSWLNAHKEQVNAQAGLVSRMANCVFTGREKRLVNCVTYFHTPSVGMKTIVRTDTGEVHKEVAMEQRELQENLFEKPEEESPAGDGIAPSQDELYDDAVRLVFEFGKGSTSLLQRRLRIGFSRAASLLDDMHARGLIGPADGSKPREITGDDPNAPTPAPAAEKKVIAISQACDGGAHVSCDGCDCDCHESAVKAEV